MKQYIKDGRIYNLPVEVKIGDKVTYTNNEKFLKENGYEEYIIAPYKPTLEEEIERSIKSINEETDEKILNDFVWNDNEFYLTMENQFNFKNLYDLKDLKEYPIIIKTKTGFTSLENKFEVTEFYLSGVQFIENCLKEGWQKKLDAEKEIRENYK
jgi:hypothetical protein